MKASSSAFLLEAKPRPAGASGDQRHIQAARFGFTVTKKLGNAVRRNRIRRRLKAAVAALAKTHAAAGFDYVIVARNAAFDRPYADLVADLATALQRVHGEGGRKTPPRPIERASRNCKKTGNVTGCPLSFGAHFSHRLPAANPDASPAVFDLRPR